MRRAARIALLAASVLLVLGCRSVVDSFADLADPSPFVRARAAGLDDQVSEAVALPALIDRLEDPDAVVRLSAKEALRQRTGRTLGYKAWGTPEERAEAVGRWRAWWAVAAGDRGPRPKAR